MNEAVIVSACRTAVGKFGGSLAGQGAAQLGAVVIGEALRRADFPADGINDIIMGQVLTAGVGQNPARQAAMAAAIPKETPAMTINHVCGSGLRAVHLAAQAIRAGDAQAIVAGGQENMSAAPHVLNQSRIGFRLGNATLVDTMVNDGLTDAFNRYHMGITAENVAREYGVSREEQDQFACLSQNKAEAARKAGAFTEEVVAVNVPQRKKDPIVFAEDEYIKEGVNIESLAGLRPAFDKEGTVTAGNASGINDGAAAVLVMDAATAKKRWTDPVGDDSRRRLLRCRSGLHGNGAGAGLARLSEKGRLVRRKKSTCFEINEAFAAQAAAVNKEMGWGHRQGQCQRWRHRLGTPHRRVGLSDFGHAPARNEKARRQERAGQPVHRRRHGDCPRRGTPLIGLSSREHIMTNNEKKTALVTGGIGGIGTAICERFVEDGYAVVAATYRGEEERFEKWRDSSGDAARHSRILLRCLRLGQLRRPARGGGRRMRRGRCSGQQRRHHARRHLQEDDAGHVDCGPQHEPEQHLQCQQTIRPGHDGKRLRAGHQHFLGQRRKGAIRTDELLRRQSRDIRLHQGPGAGGHPQRRHRQLRLTRRTPARKWCRR